MSPDLLPDLVLGTLLLLMAWGALHAPSRQDAMALFVAFGLVVALIWARLGAPDLALAEAAIGAGLTGVLLLQAARQMPIDAPSSLRRRIGFTPSALFVVLTALMFAVYILTDDSLKLGAAQTESAPEMPARVAAAMPEAGVGHPVTAVLLNFRAWDTLLELLVLLLALMGLRQLYPSNTSDQREPPPIPQAWPLLLAWARFLAPLLILTGGYLLWRGADAPGGAFQSGALLAAAAVILRLTGLLPPLRWSSWLTRLAITIGAALFLGIALATLLFGEGWLQYPANAAGTLIVMIELLATLSIAVTLTLLVIGEREDLRA